jgi:hypothetical protein
VTPTATPDTGEIQGSIWHDLNGDSSWQIPGEPLLQGSLVAIRNDRGDIVVTMSSRDGRYRAISLPPDNYVVQEVDPLGYRSTTPNKIQVRVRANTSLEVNFGDVSNTLGMPYCVYLPVQQR